MTDLACKDFVEQVTAFLDGALDPVAEERFVDHLPECDGCSEYLEQIRRTKSALADLPAETIAPATRAALLDAFRQQ
jgi:anti-sigma factor RsiW